MRNVKWIISMITNTMRGWGVYISWPCKLRWDRWKQIWWKLMPPLLVNILAFYLSCNDHHILLTCCRFSTTHRTREGVEYVGKNTQTLTRNLNPDGQTNSPPGLLLANLIREKQVSLNSNTLILIHYTY